MKKLLLITIFTIQSSYSAYYDTLPKGRRLVALNKVFVSEIDSFYKTTLDKSDMHISVDLNSDLLGRLEGMEYFLGPLKKADPRAYDEFTAGSFESDIKANVDVFGAGFAYGVTDWLTVYGVFPFYKARVGITVKRTKGNSFNEADEAIKDNKNYNPGVELYPSSEFDGDLSLFQHVVTDIYKMNPLGDWEGSGIGDIELIGKVKVADFGRFGIGASFGVILPTGSEDDPDTLQDIPFGTGHLGISLETGVGFTISPLFSFETYVKGTHYFSDKKKLRLIESKDFPLALDSGEFKVSPGMEIEYSAKLGIHFSDWFSFFPELIYQYKMEDQYSYEDPFYSAVYASGSEQEALFFKAELELSSISAFLKKSFALPFIFTISVRQTVQGKNYPHYTRADCQIRLLF